MSPVTTTATTYTVDASSATVTKNGAASTVSAIAVGDTVMVQGTVSGTNVTAKTIRDGVGQGQPAIQGNGQPVVAGTVTAINGNSVLQSQTRAMLRIQLTQQVLNLLCKE